MHPSRRFRIFSRPLAALSGLGRRLRRDRRGNYSMIVALLLPVLTGFVGLGTEAGLWLYDQQMEQTGADNAAFSAAVYYAGVGASATSATMNSAQNQAIAVAANYGLGASLASGTTCTDTPSGVTTSSCATTSGATSCSVTTPSVGTNCVQVNNPPSTGPSAGVSTCPPTTGNPCYIEVIVSQMPQQLFSRVLLSSPVTIKARAVGAITVSTSPATETGNACVLVTDTANVAQSTDLTGNASLTGTNCNLAINDPNAGALTLTGNAQITFSHIYLANGSGSDSTSSNAKVTGTISGGVTTVNPYAAQLSGKVPTVASATSGNCGSVTTTDTTTSGSGSLTTVANTTGVAAGMFAVGTNLPATLPTTNLITAVNGSTVTISNNATASGSLKPVVFSANQTANNITASATLVAGYYQSIVASSNAAVKLMPGVYFICPMLTKETANTTSGSKTVTFSTSVTAAGVSWAAGMAISDSAGALPVGTTISSIASGTTVTLSAAASSSQTGDTFYVGGQFTGAGNAVFYTPPFSSTGTLAVECNGNPYTCTTQSDGFVTGDGVTIVLLGSSGSDSGSGSTDCAQFSFSGNGNLYLVPPNSGTFSGLVIASTQSCSKATVNAANGSSTLSVTGNGTLQVYGAIDLPSYAVNLKGNASNSSGCLQLVADSLNLTGNAGLGQNCTNVGTTAINQTSSSTPIYSAALSN